MHRCTYMHIHLYAQMLIRLWLGIFWKQDLLKLRKAGWPLRVYGQFQLWDLPSKDFPTGRGKERHSHLTLGLVGMTVYQELLDRRAQGARLIIQDIAVGLGCLLFPKLWVSLGVKKRGRGL